MARSSALMATATASATRPDNALAIVPTSLPRDSTLLPASACRAASSPNLTSISRLSWRGIGEGQGVESGLG
jgi:hypothetical protein